MPTAIYIYRLEATVICMDSSRRRTEITIDVRINKGILLAV